MSKYRRPLKKKYSKKLFSKTAAKVKSANYNRSPMRGGYRL